MPVRPVHVNKLRVSFTLFTLACGSQAEIIVRFYGLCVTDHGKTMLFCLLYKREASCFVCAKNQYAGFNSPSYQIFYSIELPLP